MLLSVLEALTAQLTVAFWHVPAPLLLACPHKPAIDWPVVQPTALSRRLQHGLPLVVELHHVSVHLQRCLDNVLLTDPVAAGHSLLSGFLPQSVFQLCLKTLQGRLAWLGQTHVRDLADAGAAGWNAETEGLTQPGCLSAALCPTACEGVHHVDALD